jgi:hypothetical protein
VTADEIKAIPTDIIRMVSAENGKSLAGPKIADREATSEI